MTSKTLREAMAARSWSGTPEIFEWMAELLHNEGVNICRASQDELTRGTPVYALADANLAEVGRLMARHHIRRIPVLDDGRLLGLMDIVEIALHSEHLAGGVVDEPRA